MSSPPIPENVVAEQQLLGAILTNNALYHEVAHLLEPEFFYDPVHGRIFDICRNRINADHLVSPVTLKSIMESDEGLKELGGPAYLARLAGAAIASSQIRDYAQIIAQMKVARDALSATQNAQDEIRSGEDAQEAVARLQSALMALPEIEGRESSISLIQAGMRAIKNTNDAYQGADTLLKTGLDSLDKVIRGLAPSDLCLLGGASSMGKTSVGVDIARRVASTGKVVGIASLEMDPEQLFNRIASSQSQVPYELARSAQDMTEEQYRAWVEACKEAAETLPIHIFPGHVRDIAAIHAAAKSLKMRMGALDLVVVDYAQLCRAPGREFRERMVNVSIGLKTMAQILEVPVIALVQLDRRIGDRPDPRPQTFDIKETSQFETDADQIVFCHWAHFYLIRKGPALDKSGQVSPEALADWEADKKATLNKMELIVRKNRHGRLATAEVGCDMPTNRFWNLHKQGEVDF